MTAKLGRIVDYLSQPRFLFLYALIIFTLLLARDPFSTRTLIPNLEPYPDTFHYIVPARNFAIGEGYSLSRGYGEIQINVPPLYSLTLIPLYLINSDPRMFYAANVVFALASLYLLFLILKKVVKNRWVIGLTMFIYATSYYFYWYPQWAMAENLLIPLFLAGVYLLLNKVTNRNILFAALLTISFYATKYSAAPLALVYTFIYSIKILVEEKGLSRKNFLYPLLLVVFYIPLQLFIGSYSSVNHFRDFLNIVASVFPNVVREGVGGAGVDTSSQIFSAQHFSTNFPRYVRATLGSGERFLWNFRPMLPKYIAIFAYLGFLVGLLRKNTRLFSLSLIFVLIVQILFASTFYAYDLRFIFIVLPILIIGFSLFLSGSYRFLQKRGLKVVFYLGIIFLFIFYFYNNALRLKDQVVINLKYAETPWTYISVLRLNEYFDNGRENKPYVISPLPPYYFDYFSNENYKLLPLSSEQEFRKSRELIWGPGDYSDLHRLYEQKLEQGNKLYVSTYGLGVEGYLHGAFNRLQEDFVLNEVYSKCHDLCKLYEVELR